MSGHPEMMHEKEANVDDSGYCKPQKRLRILSYRQFKVIKKAENCMQPSNRAGKKHHSAPPFKELSWVSLALNNDLTTEKTSE